MIKLSDRLQIIADRIKPAETMADIGTDHGFLPIYLKETGICSRVIMADISEPSLGKARMNAAFCSEEIRNGLEFRAGDGLQILSRGEVEAVVIAGMGGRLIRDIMAEDMDITRSVRRFVLQPRIGQGYLRKWLYLNGFSIISEDLVYEGDYIPEIITVLSPDVSDSSYYGESLFRQCDERMKAADGDDILWRIPPWIIRAEGPVSEFLCRNIAREEKKLSNVRMAKIRNRQLEDRICEDISYLLRLKEEYENGKKNTLYR